MKRFLSIFLMVLTVLLGGCYRQLAPDEATGTSLGIEVEFPGTATRADDPLLPASGIENALHSLSIWVFLSAEGHELVAARTLTEEDFPVGGGVRRYSLPVSRSFANTRPDVDVFVLANAVAIGAGNLNENSSWEDLNGAFFGDSGTAPYYGFGLAQPVHAVDGSLGLPMSGCGKNLKIQGEEPSLRVQTVEVGRMVSRLRFVFCKTRTEGGEEEDVSIQEISLLGNQIPKKEYLFTTASSGVVLSEAVLKDNYLDQKYLLTPPATIASNDTPENLIYVNQDPQAYDQLLSEAVAAGTLTDLGYTYLRESDMRLRGSIKYTVAGKQHEREFNMAVAGDFARNHTWTVFGYFLGGRNLQLALKVLPWDYNQFAVDFSEESVNVSSKFIVDENTVDLVPSGKDQYDAFLIPGVAARGHLYITTPRGASLMIRPEGDAEYFSVNPAVATIDPTEKSGRIDIEVRRNPDIDENLTGKYITLSFTVEIGNDRVVDANSEAIDAVYRFRF